MRTPSAVLVMYDVSVMQRGCDFNALHVLGRASCLVVQVPVTRCACVPLGVAASLPDENRFSRSFLTDGSPWACLGLAFRVLKLNPIYISTCNAVR